MINVGAKQVNVISVPQIRQSAIMNRAARTAAAVWTRNVKKYFAADISEISAGAAKRYLPNFDLSSCISDIVHTAAAKAVIVTEQVMPVISISDVLPLPESENMKNMEQTPTKTLLLFKCVLIRISFSLISVFIMSYTPCLS